MAALSRAVTRRLLVLRSERNPLGAARTGLSRWSEHGPVRWATPVLRRVHGDLRWRALMGLFDGAGSSGPRHRRGS
jgi:hypothetical protein